MIGNAFASIIMLVLDALPVLSLPSGYEKAMDFVANVIGFVNIFLPLKSLVPIVLLIMLVRKFNIGLAIIRWLPFIG